MARRLRTFVIVAGVVLVGFGAWALNEGDQANGVGSVVLGAVMVLVAATMRRARNARPEDAHTRDYHFEERLRDIGDGGDAEGDGDR